MVSAAVSLLAVLLAGTPAPQPPPVEDRDEAPAPDAPLGTLEPEEDEDTGAGIDARDPRSFTRDLDEEPTAGGFTFSLSLGGARDTGLRSEGVDPIPVPDDGEGDGAGTTGNAATIDSEDSIYVVIPSLMLHRRPSRRSDFLIAYQPEIEKFEEQEELDATHHAAGARFEHLASRRTRLVLGGSLLDGEDPSRHLGGQLLVLPRTPYSQSRVYAGVEHVWTSTGLLFYVGRTATEIEPAGGLLDSGIDESEYTATVTLDKTIGSRSGFIASYSLVVPSWSHPVRVDPIDGEPIEDDDPLLPLPFDDPVHTATIGFTHRPADRIALHIAGGVHYGDEATWLGSAGIARDGAAFSFGLRYERSLLALGAFSPVGVASPGFPTGPGASLRDIVSESLTATLALRPIERLRLEQHVWGARASLVPGDRLETLSATSRVLVETVRRLGIFGQYEWFEQTGEPLLFDELSRSRFSAGLVIGLAGPPETWGVRGNPAQLQRVLPFWRNE